MHCQRQPPSRQQLLALPLLITACLSLAREVRGSSYADGGTDLACWQSALMVPCNTYFPGVAMDVDWNGLDASDATIVEGDAITIPVSFTYTSSLNVTTAVYKSHGMHIDHANLHACLVSQGFCSPFVGQSPGLVTHSAALRGNSGNLTFSFNLVAGHWTLISHYRLYTDDNVRVDFAKGITVTVNPLRRLQSADAGTTTFATVGGAVCAALCLFYALFIVAKRSSNVMKFASWRFCTIATIGGCLGNLLALLWVPDISAAKCSARVFLLPLAFNLVFYPLLLKTWRLHSLFSSKSLKHRKISDFTLFVRILVPIVLDIIIGVIWTAVAGPVPSEVNSQISDTAYEIYCMNESATSNVFLGIMLTLKAIPLFWGAHLAWRVRTIIDELNESAYLGLAMANLLFVAVFVLSMQFLIVNNPSALAIFRTFGTLETSTVTVSVVMAPKVVQLMRYGDVDNLKTTMAKRRSRRSSSESRWNSSTADSTTQRYVATDEEAPEVPTTVPENSGEVEQVSEENKNSSG